ncbi:sulfur carrier protein ThiS [uncultured Bacteroides sp.]|uniref:sulfur carrier protein ThiS n=1 Tax=uncultured Bacteroides sp. TaxID=162156 RepID=UPI002637C2FC|nr:sulfur carrier protein ThiS [uncultured Bacteroides sp.]
MKLTVNNKAVETQAANLQQLADELVLPAQGVAMAVNNRMVPRTEWASFPLTEGAQVVIIKAACGG